MRKDKLSDNTMSHCALCVSDHQGEVVDIQYGSLDDLQRAKDTGNITNQIAVVKLGKAPLLYKVGEKTKLKNMAI